MFRICLLEPVAPGTKTTTLGIAQLASGLYTVRVAATDGPHTNRFIKR